MTQLRNRKSRKLFVLALGVCLTGSMMYVSFAFGFRAGIAEDTVFILPQC